MDWLIIIAVVVLVCWIIYDIKNEYGTKKKKDRPVKKQQKPSDFFDNPSIKVNYREYNDSTINANYGEHHQKQTMSIPTPFIATDNFEFIAQNISTIYYIIKTTILGKKLTERQQYIATAIIDTFNYLQIGTIDLLDIARAYMNSECGIVGLGFYNVPHALYNHKCTVDISENHQLIYLTMQIEALIFCSDTEENHRDLVDIVIDQKEVIAKTINTVVSEGAGSYYYADLYEPVCNMLANDEFLKMVSEAESDFIKRFNHNRLS